MATLIYKAGDCEPSYTTTVYNADKTVPNLTTATAVTLKAKLTTGSTTITRTGTITDAVGGTVRFTWGTTDLSVIGVYDYEIEITWPTGRPQTVPNDSYVALVITRKAQG